MIRIHDNGLQWVFTTDASAASDSSTLSTEHKTRHVTTHTVLTHTNALNTRVCFNDILVDDLSIKSGFAIWHPGLS